MVLSSLKTQDTTNNKHLSRNRDDVDEIGTQTELIVTKNAVTQTDPVIIRSRSKSIQCKLFQGKHKSSQTVHYYKDVTTMTEQTFADGNFIYFFYGSGYNAFLFKIILISTLPPFTDAVAGRCFGKRLFLKISQNTQEI